jgi:hypothetical protein
MLRLTDQGAESTDHDAAQFSLPPPSPAWQMSW